MKVLLISHSRQSAAQIARVLSLSNINLDYYIFFNESDFLLKFKEKLFLYDFYIFDRFSYLVDDYVNLLVHKECFFIVQNFNEFKFVGKYQNDCKFRIYFSPINYMLLILDIKSATVQQKISVDEKLIMNNLELHLNLRTVSNGKEYKFLKNKEFELLKYLMMNRGRVLSRLSILECVWDLNSTISTNTVDVHVSRLRSLISKLGIEDPIRTIQCIGYLFV